MKRSSSPAIIATAGVDRSPATGKESGPVSNSSAEYLKWVALAVLVMQNSGLILFMRLSRLSSGSNSSMYCISTAVTIAEATKLLLSSALLFAIDCEFSLREFVSTLRREFVDNWKEFLKMCVPSGLYVIQNNLQYIGASHLPAAVFQVLVQMKIITTALFSVTMLSRQLSVMQWVAIVALGIGIGLVQISQQQNSAGSSAIDGQNSVIGVVAVLVSCLTSGFAGVYFEKVLKTNATSLWTRNIQLALIGIVISMVSSSISVLNTAANIDVLDCGHNV
jgi:UDP-sugar transporter A1/2/3